MAQLNINTFDYGDLVGYCTVLIGSSGSGKSRLIKEIMYRVREQIPAGIVLCPTADQNGDYKDLLPKQAIISNLNGGRLINKLNKIFKRQEEQVCIYNQVNDISVLKSLARKLEVQDEAVSGLEQIISEYARTRSELLAQDPEPHNLDELLQKIDQDKARASEKLLDAFKTAIAEEYKEKKYSRDIGITQQQHRLCKSLRINPHMLLILDDMAAYFQADVQKSEIFRKIAFQGRHVRITTLISIQSDKTLIPQIRQQAHFIAFTETGGLESFAKSNGIIDAKVAKQISEVMRMNKEEFVKSIYYKAQDKFYFVKAINKQPFRFGSNVFWSFCQYMGSIKK